MRGRGAEMVDVISCIMKSDGEAARKAAVDDVAALGQRSGR